MTEETTLLVERPRLGHRGWWYEARLVGLYAAILFVLGLAGIEEYGLAAALIGSVVGAVGVWAIRVLLFVGWNRRRLTVTDRAIRIGSVAIALADVVELLPVRGPELREAERQDAVTGPHRWRVHESHDQALLVAHRQLDGRNAGWMLGTHDADRLAQVVGEHAGTSDRPRPAGTPRPVPFQGRQGLDPFRAGVLISWGLAADIVLWAVGDLWSVATVLVLAALAVTGLRRVRIDEHGIQVGTARIGAERIRAVRCVERAEAAGASLDTTRLPLFGPRCALLVHTTDDRLWGLGIPHPVALDPPPPPPR